MKTPEWFLDTEVGEKLREIGGPEQKDDHLHHVVAVFEDDHRVFLVTKTWWSSKQRWNYVVVNDINAIVGLFYPDGEERPKR